MAKDCRLLSRIATVAAAFIALTFATGSHCGNENSVTGPSLTPTPTPATPASPSRGRSGPMWVESRQPRVPRKRPT
jgi:hypothetical protein